MKAVALVAVALGVGVLSGSAYAFFEGAPRMFLWLTAGFGGSLALAGVSLLRCVYINQREA